MTALENIKSMGIQVKIDNDGSLDLQANKQIPEDQWNKILDLAKKHKSEIIGELKEQDKGKPELINWLEKHKAQFIYGKSY